MSASRNGSLRRDESGRRTTAILLWAAGGPFPEDWPARLGAAQSDCLVDAAVREGLAGYLRRRLRRPESRALLAQAADRRLEAFYYLTIHANLRRLAVLREVLRGLQAQGVQPVLVQGASLLLTHYRDPGLRPATDIDLVVAPDERAAAAACLKRRGFRNDAHAPALFRNGETLIDLHTDLLGAERVGARRFLMETGQARMLQAGSRVEWEGLEVRCLSPFDRVIHLAHHAVKHNLERLVWLADLRSLVADWSPGAWADFSARAEDLGQQRAASLLLCCLETLFGFRPPLAGNPGRPPSAAVRCLVRRRRAGRLPAWACLFLLPPRDPLRRIQYIGELAFPRPEVLRQVFPSARGATSRKLRTLRLRQLFGGQGPPSGAAAPPTGRGAVTGARA